MSANFSAVAGLIGNYVLHGVDEKKDRERGREIYCPGPGMFGINGTITVNAHICMYIMLGSQYAPGMK